MAICIVDDIVENIGVTAPYYALQNLSVTDDEVKAEIPVEQPMDDEYGVISGAEVGRHLAVLGACALARSSNKEKHYYIVKSAVLKNIYEGEVRDSNLIGAAKTLTIDKKSGSISSVLSCRDGIPLFTLDATYLIMKAPLFEKLFRAKRQLFDGGQYNPYRKAFPLRDIKCIDGIAEARLGPLEPKDCNGHFISYPCIPVAIIMHGLSRLAGRLLSKIVGVEHAPYRGMYADVNATHFAFAGETVHMVVKYSCRKGYEYEFFCEALSETGVTYGSMTARLEYRG